MSPALYIVQWCTEGARGRLVPIPWLVADVLSWGAQLPHLPLPGGSDVGTVFYPNGTGDPAGTAVVVLTAAAAARGQPVDVDIGGLVAVSPYFFTLACENVRGVVGPMVRGPSFCFPPPLPLSMSQSSHTDPHLLHPAPFLALAPCTFNAWSIGLLCALHHSLPSLLALSTRGQLACCAPCPHCSRPRCRACLIALYLYPPS
jgi:hypothetical protein